MTKNNPTQIASILFALADLPRILTSEKCHILFMLLEEATKNVARCYQMPKGIVGLNTKRKWIL